MNRTERERNSSRFQIFISFHLSGFLYPLLLVLILFLLFIFLSFSPPLLSSSSLFLLLSPSPFAFSSTVCRPDCREWSKFTLHCAVDEELQATNLSREVQYFTTCVPFRPSHKPCRRGSEFREMRNIALRCVFIGSSRVSAG